MPASLASPIALDLVIDGDSVSAGSAFSFAAGGALTLSSSSTLNVGSGNVAFGTGSSLNVLDSTLNLNVNASQLQLNAGSTASLDGAILNIGDDVFFRNKPGANDATRNRRTDFARADDTYFFR